jgi:hypothetical protein
MDEELEAARANGNTLLTEEIENQISKLEQYQADAQHPEDDWARACPG